jgi:alpha-glucosidase
MTWVLSSHDVPRHATRLALPAGTDLDHWLAGDGTDPPIDPGTARRRARAATLLMLALPGSAYLYQGEELGLLEVADLPHHALQDPIWHRTGHTVKGRDGCRVPLPWTRGGSSHGFGSNGSWLPQPPWYADLSVQAQTGDPGSTLELYRHALRHRRDQQTHDTTVHWLSPGTPDILHIRRSNGWQCLVNFAGTPHDLPAGTTPLLSSSPLDTGRVPPESAVWLREH